MAELTRQDREEINWQGIEDLLKSRFSNLEGRMQAERFSAGYSNLTYKVRFDNWQAVLRRPPFGEIPPKAHDMQREYKLLQKIHPVFPLAPEPYLYSEDPGLMDKHFYLMEAKEGYVIDEEIPPSYENILNIRQTISESVIDSLVELHSINLENNNLLSLGKPEGFLERQVNGWIKRYNRSKTDDIEGVTELEEWLLGNIPSSPPPTIVHNDFKLNNMMFSLQNPGEVTGVFDWELCTIGDPLTDLGASLAYWTEPGDPETGLTSITRERGFYSRKEMLDLYAKKSGRDLSAIDFYLAYSFYKNAAILQQIYYRWKNGSIQDDRFSDLNVGIANLMKKSEEARNKMLV
ncbi:Predicted kinase, aminoglycoside phosphotransferase (APT) family [Thalassobacillus cyri]|uniref:Predicted kinase, aminoglycoside phosphotransferase (APT) family n=1 Tax=Thalassobacillus cyri TaxID=571932 RepID=A0A1H4E2E8_9BACI|nr:phosphotransferase family protein [Thalassobacillus cyri]SEA78959.1 Predicted kinase, aminoglycoside phosphotransferase (APT) family [Thalassobacillus cyri]